QQVRRTRKERERAWYDVRITRALESVLILLRPELLGGGFDVCLEIARRLELQHAIDAEALALTDKQGVVGTVDQGDRLPGHHGPVLQNRLVGSLVLTIFAVLVAESQQGSYVTDTCFPAVAREGGELRRRRPYQVAVSFRGAALDLRAFEVKRLTGPQIHGATDTTLQQVGRRLLIHVYASEQRRRNVLKVEHAATRGAEYLASVQCCLDLGKAADLNTAVDGGATDSDGTATFTKVTADLDAGNALERLHGSSVGQFADIFRNDRVLNGVRILFQALGALEARADPGDHHFLELDRLILLPLPAGPIRGGRLAENKSWRRASESGARGRRNQLISESHAPPPARHHA